MKKSIFLAVIVSLFLITPKTASADLTSTLAFEGFFHYDGAGLDPQETICGQGFGGSLCDIQPILTLVEIETPQYFGAGALGYELDLNLPEDPDQPYDWWVEADLWITGVYEDGQLAEEFEFHFEDEMLELNDFTLGFNDDDVAGFIASIPSPIIIPFGESGEGLTVLFEGDETAGEFLFSISGNPLDFSDDESLWIDVSGQIALTAHGAENGRDVVPEPATMLLLSGGLMGGAFLRRRKS